MKAIDDMPIKSLCPWYGSKRSLAQRIIIELGPHRAYVEPFCGSMAVLMQKPKCAIEVVNDLHADLINLARVLKDSKTGSQFYRKIRRWSLYAGVIDDAKEIIRGGSSSVDRAVAYFAMSWLGLNGYSGTDKELINVNTSVRYTLLAGGDPVTRFRSASKSSFVFGKRLRNVDIRSEDGIALLERLGDVENQSIYVDPPYIKKGAKYLHDFDWLAHRRLAKALLKFEKSRVVVSYYDHHDLTALYPGWLKVEHPTTKSLVSQGRRDSTHSAVAPEVLLINGQSFATPSNPQQESKCQ